MNTPAPTDAAIDGANGNVGLSINDTLELLREWMDKYAETTRRMGEIELEYKRSLQVISAQRDTYAQAIINALQATPAQEAATVHVPSASHVTYVAPVESHSPSDMSDANGEGTTPDDSVPATVSSEEQKPVGRPDGASTIELMPPSQFDKRGSLKKAVLNIFSQQDTFLTTEDVAGFLKAEFPKEQVDNKRIIDVVRDGRRTGQLVGYRMQMGGSAKYSYLNGLSSFFSTVKNTEDARIEEVKPTYQNKILQRKMALEADESTEAYGLPGKSISPVELFALGILK